MRKKLTGVDVDNPSEALKADAPAPRYDDRGKRRSFSSAKFDPVRKSDTLDRRKGERLGGPASPVDGNAWTGEHHGQITSPKPSIDSTPEDRMDTDKTGAWRQSRPRKPWWCFPLTVLTTILSVGILALTLRAFTTRQMDPKGCDMYYSRSVFIQFADFDTEHTRFASKYSLYLYREYGIDEDAEVRARWQYQSWG